MPKLSAKPNLLPFYNNDHIPEIGIDEAGRGPLFGRVYSAAVILPKTAEFDHSLMKDSKKFSSATKINEAADYIRSNAIYWAVSWCDEKEIDKINIRQATFRAMHGAVKQIINQSGSSDVLLLVDGNDFKTYNIFDESTQCQTHIPYTCITGGDNTYSSIAAASILAKTERDKYIEQLCATYPTLNDTYGVSSHKGYGTKKHLDAIREHGITPWHRKSYGICKTSKCNEDLYNLKIN